MEELFKSLSENVSEECFEDILGIVEEILSEDNYKEITKKYGSPEYEEGTGKPLNKAAQLETKVAEIRNNELRGAIKREENKGLSNEEAFKKVIDKRDQDKTGAGHQDAIRRISKRIKDDENHPHAEVSDYGLQFVPIQKQMEK